MGIFDSIFGKPSRPTDPKELDRSTCSLDFPNRSTLSFASSTKANIRELKEMIGTGVLDDHQIGTLATLLFRDGILVKEIETYLDEYRSRYRANLADLKSVDPKWEAADAEAREVLLQKLKPQATKGLSIKQFRNGRTHFNILSGMDKWALTLLLEGPPDPLSYSTQGVSLFDGLEQFQYNLKFYDARGQGSVHIVPESDYYRKRFVSLTLTGLARKGESVPTIDILSALSLKQLKTLLADIPHKNFRSIKEGVQIAVAVPDLQQRLAAIVAIDDAFQLLPLPSQFNLKAMSASLYYHQRIASVISIYAFQSG